MTTTGGTSRGRVLGSALRGAREAHGVSVREMARRLESSHPTVIAWEQAKRIPSGDQVERYLDALDVQGPERGDILRLAEQAVEPQWLPPGVSEQLADIMDYERTAESVFHWSPMIMPGLLQTGDYARPIVGHSETFVTLRMGRRDVLTREQPVRLVAVLGEAAFRQRIGGRSVMLGQVRHLQSMATLPNVSLHMLPFGSGWHAGLMGPFILYRFGAGAPVVHLEHYRAAAFLYEPTEVSEYEQAASKIIGAAMGSDETADWLNQEAVRLEKE